MNLSIEIQPDYNGTISIVDKTLEIEGEYIPESTEEVLTRYFNFKYSETCTIDALKYISSEGETLLNVYYTDHDSEADSIRIPLTKDGYYSVDHIVLPTTDWLEKVKDLDLSTYSYIYVTDGYNVYKYSDSTLTTVEITEVLEVNPENTTISIASYKVFSIDRLKECYATNARNILNNGVKCSKINDTLKFNRDFLWMTINVINIYLEKDLYSEAQLVLENLSCYNFCNLESSTESKTNSCGCHH